MKIIWRCNCGFEGNSDLGCWMRCDNPNCISKNAFQIIQIINKDYCINKGSFESRLSNLEEDLRILKQKLKEKFKQ